MQGVSRLGEYTFQKSVLVSPKLYEFLLKMSTNMYSAVSNLFMFLFFFLCSGKK